MIRNYHRPTSLDEALALLSQADARPMGGGTVLNRPGPGFVDAVDLQAVGLGGLEPDGSSLAIGATVTLERLNQAEQAPEALKRAIRLEASLNLREMATAAGQLVAADGRSAYACAMLALDARLVWAPGDVEVGLGDWLPLRGKRQPGRLITAVKIALRPALYFETIGRTPGDLPIVCLAAAHWPSGRTRVALGGFGDAPVLAFDGPEPAGADAACQDAYSRAGDAWASAEYRAEMAAVLARRATAEFTREGG